MAKENPATNTAGSTCKVPRKPAKAATSQMGTITEKTGSCRPTMAEPAQQHNDWNGGEKRGQYNTTGWIVLLRPGHGLSPCSNFLV